MKSISILGSTGSIGQNALSIVEKYPDRFSVVALAANSSVEPVEKQVRKFQPKFVALNDKRAAHELKIRLADLKGVKVFAGSDGIREIATIDEVELVLEAMGGSVGLLPTLAAIKAGKNLAFVNKEVLVMGGSLVLSEVEKNKVQLLPIDSEISAIFQCLEGQKREKNHEINRLILTASGGPFRQMSPDRLNSVTPKQALNHPNWKMGKKVTIDSATMMNKGFELIEAKWLFNIEPEKIDVIIHPESIIHSMVEFIDNSIIAQLGTPDMRIPIQYALSHPDRIPTDTEKIDFCSLKNISFEPIDLRKFPCLKLARQAIEDGGTFPTVLSSADEIAVEAFLDGRISFTDIPKLIEMTLEKHSAKTDATIDEILEVDRWAKSVVSQQIEG